jgi:SAM-dependent methyltransferase
LAVEFGCHVTVVDLTESYVQAASELTARLGLADRVTHQVGNALELPFEDGNFGVVWTQNSGMNIADKERLYKGFFRVLQSGGLLALGEPMAGPVQPPIFPLMWAVDAATSFLRTPDEMRDMIEDAGFRARAWDDVTSQGGLPNSRHPRHCDGRRHGRHRPIRPAQSRRATHRQCSSGFRPAITVA